MEVCAVLFWVFALATAYIVGASVVARAVFHRLYLADRHDAFEMFLGALLAGLVWPVFLAGRAVYLALMRSAQQAAEQRAANKRDTE